MPKFRRPKQLKELRKEKVLRENENKKLDEIEQNISTNLDTNLDMLKGIFGKETGDIVYRRFHIGGNENYEAALVYVDGLVNSTIMNNFILRSGMIQTRRADPNEPVTKNNLFDIIKQYSLEINQVDETNEMRKAVRHILNGDTAMFIDGSEKVFGLDTKGWEHRAVEEPTAEAVVRGSREGFTETFQVNTALLRLRLKDPDLRMKMLTVGERTNTVIALAYIDGVCDDGLLNKIEKRIKRIEIDGILESGYIEQMIEENHWSPFSTVQYTERPDKVAANLLEGRVGIIVDGTPFALIAPAILSQFYQSPEDYYERFWIGTFIRFMRLISIFFSLLAPSIYIALTAFHPEMIPSDLLASVAAGRATVPFPAVVEAFMMEFAIEILREASVRLPGLIGPTIGIVGALVVGEAAVQAGLVSPLMVIIVALTTIGSFASPSYSAAISVRLLRFPMMLAAGTFGLYGIMLFWLLIILHLSSLKSFGVPYVAPLSPSHFFDMKDLVFRAPMQWMKRRPITTIPKDEVRQGPNNKRGDDDGEG